MLFSRIEESLTALRIAIEITAAGIDEANVSPTLRPRYTFAAVKTVVMSAPRIRPRSVSSLGFMGPILHRRESPGRAQEQYGSRQGCFQRRIVRKRRPPRSPGAVSHTRDRTGGV